MLKLENPLVRGTNSRCYNTPSWCCVREKMKLAQLKPEVCCETNFWNWH